MRVVVRRVEPAGFTKISALGVEEQRVNVLLDFLDPFEERPTLGDGFRVEARIVVWQRNGVVKIPAGALFRQHEEQCVYVVEDGIEKLRQVHIGRINALEAEVLGGLYEGQVVIMHPGDKVKDGGRVVGRS
jgi:HlyD family secretion protein